MNEALSLQARVSALENAVERARQASGSSAKGLVSTQSAFVPGPIVLGALQTALASVSFTLPAAGNRYILLSSVEYSSGGSDTVTQQMTTDLTLVDDTVAPVITQNTVVSRTVEKTGRPPGSHTEVLSAASAPLGASAFNISLIVLVVND